MQTDNDKESAEKLQQNNATGANNGEQGRASFMTGSTSQGGSNYGQGSSQLGGESYQQGDTSNNGSNYSNEAGKLGNSTVGTNEEGSSSADAGTSGGTQKMTAPDTGRSIEQSRDDEQEDKVPKEGERRDTDLESDSSLGAGRSEDRSSGSWSAGTIQE